MIPEESGGILRIFLGNFHHTIIRDPTMRTILLLIFTVLATTTLSPAGDTQDPQDPALERGVMANEGFRRCNLYLHGWLAHADPKTGLIPRNLQNGRGIWNAKDSAADNYPFMVLTAAVTERALFEGRMREMLETERRLTSRLDGLPDTWSFSKEDFADAKPDLGRMMFGASEYIKDGLMPLTEWLGPSPWSERMIEILDAMWKHAPIETKYGNIVSTNVEVNGEMLQVLSRVYWMTGEDKYLEWAVRLGDYYLLGDHHPTRNMKRLRLRDHGCEIVSGLCELYATVHYARPKKKEAYREPIHAMLDRILEVGRNEHGLFYDAVNPIDGKVIQSGTADTWGYTFDGFHTVFLIDGTEAYRTATRRALAALKPHYSGYPWEGRSSDGIADSVESALNLINREPDKSAEEWIDSELRRMWAIQKDDGVIEGWHGDGNFARTTLMACFWKTQGTTIVPWREDVVFGALAEPDGLTITLRAEKDWDGLLGFDTPRHRTTLKMPMDWPRINQFPEWFTVEAGKRYTVLVGDKRREILGKALAEGLPLQLKAGESLRVRVSSGRQPAPSEG